MIHLKAFLFKALKVKLIVGNHKHYVEERTMVISSKIQTLDKKSKMFQHGVTHEKHIKDKAQLLTNFLDYKLYEAFLESGPQFVFQLMVIFQDGVSSPVQWFTIVIILL